MKIRTLRCPSTTLCILAGLALGGCGQNGEPSEVGAETDTDADGSAEANAHHELEPGAGVTTFEWFQGGLTYAVVDADDRPTLHHSALGETPLFIPTPTEWSIQAYASPDEDLLTVQLADSDFENGQLCAFDVRELSDRVALGCENVEIHGVISLFVTQPEL